METQPDWRDECVCKVCGDIKTEARQLECGHSFCTLCLRDYLMQYEERGTFYSFLMCPVCSIQTSTKLGVLSLPRAHHLDEPIEHLKNLWKKKEEEAEADTTAAVSYPVLDQMEAENKSTDFGDSSFLAGVEWEDYSLSTNSPTSSFNSANVSTEENLNNQSIPSSEPVEAPAPQQTKSGLKDYFSSFYQPPEVKEPPVPPKKEPQKIPHTETKPLPNASLEEPPKTKIAAPEQAKPPPEETSGGFTGFFSSIIDSIKNTISPPDDVTSTATGVRNFLFRSYLQVLI